MASTELRKRVLTCFKKLHRTRLLVFKGDQCAIQAAGRQINDEFKKVKHVADPAVINQLLSHAEAVEAELRTTVIQACEEKPGVFVAHLNPDTIKMNNVPYKECTS